MFDAVAIKQDFSKAAARYDAHALLQHAVRKRCIALVRSYFKTGDRVLDVGCGTGALAAETNWNITGLDLSYAMCHQARQKCASVNADATRLPFADDTFDGIFSSLMLQWVGEPRRVFGEMARIVKPGGHLAISTLTDGTLAELQDAFAQMGEKNRVSDFFAPLALRQKAASYFKVMSASEEIRIDHYENAHALMQSLQTIGAANKNQLRPRGLTTPRLMQRLEQQYGQRREREGLPATWNIAYLLLQK